MIGEREVQGRNECDQIAFCAFHSFLVEGRKKNFPQVSYQPILAYRHNSEKNV